MSIRSLTALAVERDRAEPGTTPKGGQRGEIAGTPGTEVPQTYVDVLTSAIPTEPLAAYTALVGIYAASIGATGNAYLALRWWAYAGFLVITAVAVWAGYSRKSRKKVSGGGATASAGNERSLPVLELVTAVVAAGAWGLAMPDSPIDVVLDDPIRPLVKATAIVAGAAIVALLAMPLQTATGKGSPSGQRAHT